MTIQNIFVTTINNYCHSSHKYDNTINKVQEGSTYLTKKTPLNQYIKNLIIPHTGYVLNKDHNSQSLS